MRNNKLKELNKRLNTRIAMLEQQLTTKERLLSEIAANNSSKRPRSARKSINQSPTRTRPDLKDVEEITLVTTLKKMVKDLQAENQTYEEELTELKKDLRSTKLEEMTIELDMYSKECTRLRKKAEKAIKTSYRTPAEWEKL